MTKRKIIFANRKTCFTHPGGDTVQMMKTKEFLEKNYPVEIKICLTPNEVLEDKESIIVHIFNLETVNETNAFIEAAKTTEKKVVLSTINWDFSDLYLVKYLAFIGIYSNLEMFLPFKNLIIKFFNFFLKFFFSQKFKNYIQKGMYGTKEYFEERQVALNNADILLPNSDEEAKIIFREYKQDKSYFEKVSIVPNAIEYNALASDTTDKYPELKDFVLEVGRIEPTKNQMGLVKALFDYPQIPIVIIGKVIDERYYKDLKKIATQRGNVYFLNQAKQEDVFKLYPKALCHALPSFKETTGLVNIEALLSGTQIVVASKEFCPVDYYEFDKYGYICNPYKTDSIKKAILSAIEEPKRVKLSKSYIEKFSYNNVAKLTYHSYLSLIKVYEAKP